MKIKFLIQSSYIKLTEIDKKVEALKAINAEFADFGMIPFTKTITGLENILEKDYYYVFLGSIKTLKVILEANHITDLNEFLTEEQINLSDYYLDRLKKGFFYDIEKFDQAYYNSFDLPLFNKNSLIMSFNEAKDKKFNETMFVKPTSDLKAFNGGFIEKDEIFKDFLNRQQLMSDVNYEDVKILIAPLKNSIEEYRFFVVNKEVVSGSKYMNRRVVTRSEYVPDFILQKAKEYALLYQPSAVFTLDLVLTDNNIVEIMEYNCFNCSGVYLNDLKNTYSKLITYLNYKYKD